VVSLHWFKPFRLEPDMVDFHQGGYNCAAPVPLSRIRFASTLEPGGVQAVDSRGRALAIEKTRKNRWRVQTSGASLVTVHYKLYCRAISVRTNWLAQNFALLSGAATFLTPIGNMDRAQHAAATPFRVPLTLGGRTGAPVAPDRSQSNCGAETVLHGPGERVSRLQL
jgi:hypothetical protein